MLKNKPVKPEELVVNWVEFLGEFKNLDNLNIAGKELGFAQYFLLDVILGISAIVSVVIFFVWKILYFYYWWCFQTSFIHGKT